MGLVLDAAVVLFALFGVIMGFLRGLYREVARIAVAVVSVLGGLLLRGVAAEAIEKWGDVPHLIAQVLGFPAAALSAYVVAAVAAKIVEVALELGKPSFLLRYTGAIAGGVRGILLGLVLAAVLGNFPLPGDPFRNSGTVATLRRMGISTSPSLAGPYAANVAALSRVAQDAEQVRALADAPEIRALAESPAIREMIEDPDLRRFLENRDFGAVMSHPSMERVLADSQLLSQIQGLDLERILRDLEAARAAAPPDPVE